MGDFISRSDPAVFIRSGNDPLFPEADWIGPDPQIGGQRFRDAGIPTKYVRPRAAAPSTLVEEMDAGEKAAVDAAEAAAVVTENRAGAIDVLTVNDPEGLKLRELIELFNKRDNYLTNRIAELQAALDAMKATSGAAQNIRDAIPGTWLATNTRTRAQAITDYTDDINAGGADS